MIDADDDTSPCVAQRIDPGLSRLADPSDRDPSPNPFNPGPGVRPPMFTGRKGSSPRSSCDSTRAHTATAADADSAKNSPRSLRCVHAQDPTAESTSAAWAARRRSSTRRVSSDAPS